MEPATTALLDELYRIDPALKDHETALIPLIEKLLAHKPDIHPDEKFVQELRAQLAAHAEALSRRSATTEGRGLTLQRFSLALAGLLVGVIVAAPSTYIVLNQKKGIPLQMGSPLFQYSILREAAKNAFGDLQSINLVPGGEGRGGGGGAEVSTPSVLDSGISGKMIAPAPQEFQYVYDGPLPDLSPTVDVLRREKSIGKPAASAFLGKFNAGMANLGSFPGATVDSVMFSQDVDFGYTISLMFSEGQIGISQNYARWPHPEAQCRDEACYRNYRMTIGDIPSDDELIRIAGDFIQAHSIDVSRYGAPEVDRSWKQNYDETPDKSVAYVPEAIRVLYPLLIEGKAVYDMGGMKSGISVNVHAKQKRVNDVWGIQNQTYVSSAYDGVTHPEEIKAYLNNIGRESGFLPTVTPARDGAQAPAVTTVTLGAPTVGYTLYYLQDGVQSKELLVPALIFPVLQVPEGDVPVGIYQRNTVIVPLAKELLEKGTGGPVLLQSGSGTTDSSVTLSSSSAEASSGSGDLQVPVGDSSSSTQSEPVSGTSIPVLRSLPLETPPAPPASGSQPTE